MTAVKDISMRKFIWLMGIVVTACGGSAADTPAPNPDVTAQDAQLAETTVDAAADAKIAADTGAADGVQGADTAVDSGADLGAVDASSADTGPADVAVVDAGPVDTGAPDVAAVDTGPDVPPKESEWGGPCSAETACKFPSCIAPGQSPGCGMCKKIDDGCQSDADCAAAGAKLICKQVTCACGGESSCQNGCAANAECAVGQFCAPTGHCVALVCKKLGADPSCPVNFECTDPSNPKCQRKACTASSECQGACVKGFCYDKAGTCMPPPP